MKKIRKCHYGSRRRQQCGCAPCKEWRMAQGKRPKMKRKNPRHRGKKGDSDTYSKAYDKGYEDAVSGRPPGPHGVDVRSWGGGMLAGAGYNHGYGDGKKILGASRKGSGATKKKMKRGNPKPRKIYPGEDLTIEPCRGATYRMKGRYCVYAYSAYPSSSVMAGGTRRRSLGSFDSIDSALSVYPSANLSPSLGPRSVADIDRQTRHLRGSSDELYRPRSNPKMKRKNPGKSEFLTKEYGSKPTEDFADYLRYVAGDMRGSGSIEAAREHGKMAGIIRRLARTGRPTDNDLSYAQWLNTIYGPDLIESGKEATAEDVFQTVWYIDGATKRKNPKANWTGVSPAARKAIMLHVPRRWIIGMLQEVKDNPYASIRTNNGAVVWTPDKEDKSTQEVWYKGEHISRPSGRMNYSPWEGAGRGGRKFGFSSIKEFVKYVDEKKPWSTPSQKPDEHRRRVARERRENPIKDKGARGRILSMWKSDGQGGFVRKYRNGTGRVMRVEGNHFSHSLVVDRGGRGTDLVVDGWSASKDKSILIVENAYRKFEVGGPPKRSNPKRKRK